MRNQKGSRNNNWKGGKKTDGKGRILIFAPNHPHCHRSGYIYRYRLVMEKKLGRLLKRGELVHHKNGKVEDDSPSNLEVTTRPRHSAHHAALIPRKNGRFA